MKNTLRVVVCLFVSLFVSHSVIAAGDGGHKSDQEMIKVEKVGDAKKGKNKAAVCGACHGRDGNSTIPSNPKLAGQNVKYLVKQMQDFKSGARKDAVMASQISGRSLADMEDIAAYYAEQETSLSKADKDLVTLGQKIYRGGNMETGVPACIACHGPAGKGVAAAGFPALSGQHAQYTAKQLKAFRSAGRNDHTGTKRTNDAQPGEPAMMQDVVAKMSDDEIEAVSSFIAGLR